MVVKNDIENDNLFLSTIFIVFCGFPLADGWIEVRIKGSHHHFKHPKKEGIVTIVHPDKIVKPGTANNILRQAGLK